MAHRVILLKAAAVALFAGFGFSFMDPGHALFSGIVWGIAIWIYLGRKNRDSPPAKVHGIFLGILYLTAYSVALFFDFWERPLISGMLLAGFYFFAFAAMIQVERHHEDRKAEQGADRKPDNVLS